MKASARRDELKTFLRSRRAAVAPESSGFARGKRRLTKGLRREELSALAGVGLTWYTWLEQGREINVSADALGRIARALQLTSSDEAYLFALAGVPAPKSASPPTMPAATELLLEGFTAGPALALGPTMNVLASNRLAERVYSLDAVEGRFAKNHLWRGVMDPARRRLYADWERSIRNFVGLFRAHAASFADPTDDDELIATLVTESPEFARIWSDQETRPLSASVLRLEHPELGPLAVHSFRLTLQDFAGLLFFLPPADDATARAFAAAAP